MSGISDAAAITWVIKNNIASSACMTNQMTMYRKGVLDGKDKDTVIEEDWTNDNSSINIEIDPNGNDVPNNGLGPGFVDLQKGVFWKILRGDGYPEYWIRFWVSSTPVTIYNQNYKPYQRVTGRLHLTEYENGIQVRDQIATYSSSGAATGAFVETGISYNYPSYSKLVKVYSSKSVQNAGTDAEAHSIKIDYDYMGVSRNASTGEITNEQIGKSGTATFPGPGLRSTYITRITNVSCTSEIPDFLQTN